MSSKKVDVGFMKFVVDDETYNREVVEDASKHLISALRTFAFSPRGTPRPRVRAPLERRLAARAIRRGESASFATCTPRTPTRPA